MGVRDARCVLEAGDARAKCSVCGGLRMYESDTCSGHGHVHRQSSMPEASAARTLKLGTREDGPGFQGLQRRATGSSNGGVSYGHPAAHGRLSASALARVCAREVSPWAMFPYTSTDVLT